MKATALSLAGFLAIISAETAAAGHYYIDREGDSLECTFYEPCASIDIAASKWPSEGGVISMLSPGEFGGLFTEYAFSLDGFGPSSIATSLQWTGGAKHVFVKNAKFSAFSPALFYSPGSVSFTNVDVSPYDVGGITSGIVFAPTGPANLTLSNVVFTNASAGTGAAIRIVTGGHNVNVSLENVQVSGGTRGIVIDAGGGGFAKVSIKDSTFANIAGAGISAYSGIGNVRLYLDNVTSVNNTHGLVAHGARTIAWLGSSTIAGNSIGVLRQSGGAVQSYKDNYIFNNNTDGTPLSGSYAPAAVGIGDEVAVGR